MPKSQEIQEHAVHRFWDRYLAEVHKSGVNPSIDRWYVIRAEQYVKAFPDRRLKDHTQSDVVDYFQSLGRDHTLKDWQFK